MKLIKDKSGGIVLGVDDTKLYYLTWEKEDYNELGEKEIINLFINGETEMLSLEHLKKEKHGILKLNMILDFQAELGLISDIGYVENQIEKNIPYLSESNAKDKGVVYEFNERVILIEREGSGPVSAWMNFLYLDESVRQLITEEGTIIVGCNIESKGSSDFVLQELSRDGEVLR